MATYDLSKGIKTKKLGNDVVKAQQTADFSLTNAVSGDFIQLVTVPAGSLVSKVAVQVVTAEGGAATGVIGDGSDDNGWITSLDLNATGVTFSPVTSAGAAYVLAGGKFYDVEDTIDLHLSSAVDAAKIKTVVEYSVVE